MKVSTAFFSLATIVFTPTLAHAQQHWADQVTYLEVGGTHPNCVLFQTTQTQGISGFDNSSTGNAGAAGYTGNAQWNVVGVSQTGGGRTKQFTSGLVAQILGTSRYSAGTFTMDWVDLGVNTTAMYPDCAMVLHAADQIGQ
jgi:hypothetical protein